MEYSSSPVYRNLDAKMRIIGLEALDLLAVLIVAGVMNLFFGHTSLALPLGVGLPALTFLILYFGKRGKPDGYLGHLIRYQISPGYYSASTHSNVEYLMQTRIYELIE